MWPVDPEHMAGIGLHVEIELALTRREMGPRVLERHPSWALPGASTGLVPLIPLSARA